ncbi:MAG: hypothetical protein ACI81G_000723, partial [Gammaproteobacteria bacterium]
YEATNFTNLFLLYVDVCENQLKNYCESFS